MIGQFYRILLRATFLALGLTVAAMIAGVSYQSFKQQQAHAAHTEFTKQLYRDPIAMRLRAENEERCAPKSLAHYWICGAIIQAPPDISNGSCSSAERPLFYGSLEDGTQEFTLADSYFVHEVSVAGRLVSPTNDATPYGYPNIFPPDRLHATEPDFGGIDNRIKIGWAIYQNVTVVFFKGSRDWSLTPEQLSTFPVTLRFKHPIFPLMITETIPLEDMDNWKTRVANAIVETTPAVVSFDPSKSCSQPPENVRFSFNQFNPNLVAKLRDWIVDHAQSTSAPHQ